MQFSRLKLTGFKSFVDPTELVIEPGLTGIVGPNGCGKSNLVDSLRWVMGESSAKQIRGGEMDDVIFSGTAARPARNLAAVELHLENRERDAPAPYNDGGEIVVSRRIERGVGSDYRINGKEARARDVQLLFADVATGAHAAGIVGQGEIGAVISAKPAQRRRLLEEAAGITGLHARRHEAELRLRAAEANLERLDDVLAALQAQLQALRRQARQAARYRSLSGRIRKAEAALLYRRWARTEADVGEAEARLGEIVQTLAARGRKAAAAAAAQAEAAAALPGLRRAEAEAAAAAHRLAVEQERLDEEAKRVAETTAALTAQHEQIGGDIARELRQRDEAAAALARLAEEADSLRAAQASEASAKEAAAADAASARAALDRQDAAVAELTERAAETEAERAALERRLAALADRLARLEARAGEIAAERAEIASRTAQDEAAAAQDAVDHAAAEAETQRAAFDAAARAQQTAAQARDAAEEAERDARGRRQAIETRRTRLEAEVETLAALVGAPAADAADHDTPQARPVLERITVAPGYEIALGAALGDDLAAPLEASAPSHWRTLDAAAAAPAPALPVGATPLADFVEAPPALARRLAQIGVVDGAEGPGLQTRLVQGQRLVSRDGALWRWDGFTVAADAPGSAAIRLRQRNRLSGLSHALEACARDAAVAAADHVEAEARLNAARATAGEARQREAQGRAAARAAEQALGEARAALAATAEAAAADRARRAALAEAAADVAAACAEADQEAAKAQAALGALPASEAVRAPVERARAALGEKRAALERSLRAQEQLARDAQRRAERLQAIDDEVAAWRRRDEGTVQQIDSLEARRAKVGREREALRARPLRIAALRESVMSRIADAEAKRGAASDALAVAESRLNEREADLRAANEALAEAREAKARADGKLEQAQALREVDVQHIDDRLGCAPAAALAIAGVDDPDRLPELAAVERQVERLLRERDNMGAVNLRAEEEAAELCAQIEGMEAERADLVAAIARLRNGIASLNRQGRERLLAAFDEVNRHFQELFARLFGGGRAHLSLIGDDDPLEAGLEIMARPPGKRLQVLSLLSGGEKALAATALLFAVFLTKPAPICVLDEVDAPLDDANVDRFCDLVAEIALSGRTRFLVVTHHRLTMTRMDRLYGVTMGERGVSQLVSVDLHGVERLKAAE